MDISEIRLLRTWSTIVASCLRFAQNSYHQGIQVVSPTTGEIVASEDMFHRPSKGIYTIKGEHFPVDEHFKYVHLSRNYQQGAGALFIETTALKFTDFEIRAKENKSPFGLQGKTIVREGHPLVSTRTQQWFNDKRRPRTQLRTIDPLQKVNIRHMVDLFEFIWGYNICDNDWSPQPDKDILDTLNQASSATPSMRLELRQVLSPEQIQRLEQCLRQDQCPLMQQQMQQTLRMIAFMTQRSEVLKLNNKELTRYIEQRVSRNPVLETE